MYTPNKEILEKYADVMVNFALRWWDGINHWDVVFVQIPESAKPFYIPLQTAILRAWWHPIMQYIPDWVARSFYENASDEQLSFVPEAYQKWKIESITHNLLVIADSDLHELDWIEPSKMMKRIKANQKIRDLRDKKEREWKFSRTICMYGTEAMAEEAWLSLEEYRNQIVSACFLDEENPVQKRKEINAETRRVKNKLNELKLEYVHVIWPDEDLKVKIWADRLWEAWWWCNIPSFEVFTSPDCRDVNGRMKCNQPLYRYWSLVEWIRLEFKDWKLISAHADKNDEILQEMIKIEWMDYLWEFSLTDARISKITHFMAETLFDENVWGRYGNTHIALWRWFDECYAWDKKKLSNPRFKKSIWLNMSAEHVDVISTAKRKVVWILADGKEILIYKDGRFVI
jgi:aminopeptidase